MVILLFFLFSNIWIWKIFNYNFWLFVLTVLSTVSSYLAFKGGSEGNTLLKARSGLFRSDKYIRFLSVLLILILMLAQYKTTTIAPLTGFTNDQIRIRDMRLKEYPPLYIKLYGKVLWIPGAHWIEGRYESVALRRMSVNVGDVLDINQFFFASHPRQRVGVNEFEKFPYILVPLFLIGVTYIVKEKKYSLLLFLLFIPLLTISFIGNHNLLGAFSLFPFIALCVTLGAESVLPHFQKKSVSLLLIFFTVYFLVLLQTISYEVF